VLTLLTIAMLHAAPSVALPPLSTMGVEKGASDFYGELLAQELEHRGLRVMTSRAIEAVLGAERQRQLMGCSGECVAELSGALGVQAIILADVARLDRSYGLNVKVLSAGDGATLASFNERAPDADALPLTIARAAWQLSAQLLKRGWTVSPGDEPRPPASRLWALIPAIVGVAGVGAGVALELQADAELKAISTANSATSVQAAAGRGRTAETTAAVAIGLGAACLVTAGVLALVLGDAPVKPAVSLSPGGAGLSLVGVLP
jgi:hypothetical protein